MPSPSPVSRVDMDLTNSISNREKRENIGAFFTYEGTKELIKIYKKINKIRYEVYREELLRQLAHIKAVENDDYAKSPYNELQMHNYNIPIHMILKRLYNYENKNNKWHKTVNFFLLQLEHGIAMEKRKYIESPYYKAQEEEVHKLHNNITEYRAARIHDKYEYVDTTENSNIALYDHLILIRTYHEVKEKIIETDKSKYLDQIASLSEDEFDTDFQQYSKNSSDESDEETEEESSNDNDKQLPSSDEDTGCEDISKGEVTDLENKGDKSSEEDEEGDIEDNEKEIDNKEKVNEQMCTVKIKWKEDKLNQIIRLEDKINFANNEKIILEKVIWDKQNEIERYKDLLDEKEEKIKEKMTEQQELEEKIQEKIWQINKIEKQMYELQKSYEEQKENNIQLTDKLNKLEVKIREKQNEIANKTTKIDNLHKELQNQQKIKNNKKQFQNKGTTTVNFKNTNRSTQTTKNKEEEKAKEINSNDTHLQRDKEKVESDQREVENEKREHSVLEEQLSIRTIKEMEFIKIEEQLHKLEKMLEDTTIKMTNSCREETSIENDTWEQNNYIDAAILIKCLEGVKISELQELINIKFLEQEQLPIFFSRTSRNRKVIIIKTQSEKQLLELQQQIEKIDEIKNKAEIQYRQHNTKRIIITGIPKDTKSEYFTNLIKLHPKMKNNPYIKIQKVIQKTISKYYQLVLEVDDTTSVILLRMGYLNVGLRNCGIHLYRPVVRCSNCQLYGHPESRCRRNSICAFCAMGHHTSKCINTDKLELRNCANCLYSSNYQKHTANSPLCPTFINHIKYRNESSSLNNSSFGGGGL